MPTPTDYIEIPLTQGQFARVSACKLATHPKLVLKWRAVWMPLAQKFYAARHDTGPDGKRYVLYLHRYILGLEKGDRREGDHVDRDPLNNTDDNLRFANRAEQTRNQKMKKCNSSGFKGIWKPKRGRKWRAKVVLNRKIVFLADFNTPEEAHAAYCEAVKRFHGEFASTT